MLSICYTEKPKIGVFYHYHTFKYIYDKLYCQEYSLAILCFSVIVPFENEKGSIFIMIWFLQLCNFSSFPFFFGGGGLLPLFLSTIFLFLYFWLNWVLTLIYKKIMCRLSMSKFLKDFYAFYRNSLKYCVFRWVFIIVLKEQNIMITK